jgi:putative acetyltransferase
MIELHRTDSDHNDFKSLVIQLDMDLNIRYRELQKQYDPHNKIESIDTIVIAYFEKIPAGCGCFKKYDNDTVEIKRMFVKEEYRGKGIATMILNELECWAKEKKYHRTLLETGIKQTEAIRLYEKMGYKRTENFGQYIGNKNSICMQKELCL